MRIYTTASEAWPPFERAVLRARTEVIGCFRIFDLRTKLRAPEARAVGDDWFDLLAHAVRRGVRVDLTVADFDAVMATSLHEEAMRTLKQGQALAEHTGAGTDRLRVTADRHTARAGVVPWAAFLPLVMRRKQQEVDSRTDEQLGDEARGLGRHRLPSLSPVTHHQKLAVIDRAWLYLGGLDLNERRWDTPAHDRPAGETWSDVQLTTDAPDAVAEAHTHLTEFVAVTSGLAAPSPMTRIRRTLSAPRTVQAPFVSPRTIVREIEQDTLDAFAAARHLIHIETQFFRSMVLARGLTRAALRNPDLRLVMILPALPEELAYYEKKTLDVRYGLGLEARATGMVKRAFGDRALLATPVQPRPAPEDDWKR
ncbi:MAG: phosphatidylserine synthase, partial [Shimia sp.]